MTVHNRRCDCCGDRLPSSHQRSTWASSTSPGVASALGCYCRPCWTALEHATSPGEGHTQALHFPQHHPDWSAERHRSAHAGART